MLYRQVPVEREVQPGGPGQLLGRAQLPTHQRSAALRHRYGRVRTGGSQRQVMIVVVINH